MEIFGKIAYRIGSAGRKLIMSTNASDTTKRTLIIICIALGIIVFYTCSIFISQLLWNGTIASIFEIKKLSFYETMLMYTFVKVFYLMIR